MKSCCRPFVFLCDLLGKLNQPGSLWLKEPRLLRSFFLFHYLDICQDNDLYNIWVAYNLLKYHSFLSWYLEIMIYIIYIGILHSEISFIIILIFAKVGAFISDIELVLLYLHFLINFKSLWSVHFANMFILRWLLFPFAADVKCIYGKNPRNLFCFESISFEIIFPAWNQVDLAALYVYLP